MPAHAAVYAPVSIFPTAKQLEPLAPGAQVDLDEAAGLIRLEWPGLQVDMSRMPDEQVPEHLMGFQGYVRQNGGAEGLAIRVLHTMAVWGFTIEPGFDAGGRAMKLVAGVTHVTDGICFLDGEVYDAAGRGLLFGEGPERPDAARVAARALLLLALATRGLLDEDAGQPSEGDADGKRRELLDWLRAHPVVLAEADDDERALLETPVGQAGKQAVINAVWRAEGAAVLMWALGARKLPAPDANEHPYEMARGAGVMGDGPPALLEQPCLREPEDLERLSRTLLAIHWRLVEQRMRPGRVDLARFAATGPFGAIDLGDTPLVDGDLAIGGVPVASADPGRVQLATSAAVERHHAANWLIGSHPVYSRVQTPT